MINGSSMKTLTVALVKILVVCVASSTKFDVERDHVEVLLPHYALHPKKAMQLAMMEENLVPTLRNIYTLMQKGIQKNSCESTLLKYLNEFDEHIGGVVKGQGENGIMNRASKIAENPNLLFKMIRRIFVTLVDRVYKSCKGTKWGVVRSCLEETFSVANLAPPTERDLDDALLGLIRIQYIYGLSAASIQRGTFQNVHTNATLNFDDCMALGHKALEMDAQVMAYQWLTAAESLTSNQTTKNSSDLIDSLESGWMKLMNLSGYQTLDELHKHFGGNRRQEKINKFLLYKSYATCRGETPPFHHQIYPTGLYCVYTNKWNPYFFINPLKVEIISESPIVVQFYEVIGEKYRNFLSEATCSSMTRTETATQFEEESKYGDFITSISSLLQKTESEEQDELLNNLDRKVSLLTGLVVGKKSRAMQVSVYGALGGYYDFHHDTLQESVEDLTDEGDRIATVLMPLKDVKLGGYTAFPKIGVFAKPIKGSLILWHNLWRNGKPDVRTLHGGCPVILGFKEVARRGIDQHMNIWNFPCHINPML